jgi:hypothetical protein
MSVTLKCKKCPPPTFERELTNHHKYDKSLNKPFNYQSSKIAILFISYLRICWTDFDATSSDFVAFSLLCRTVQARICFIERKSRKVDNQGKWDLIAEPVEIRVTSGASQKVKVSVFPSKSWSFPLKNSSSSSSTIISPPRHFSVSASSVHPMRTLASVHNIIWLFDSEEAMSSSSASDWSVFNETLLNKLI